MCYERITQTVTKVLIKYTDSGDQDEYLDAMMFSYQTRIHASTKYPLPPNVSNAGRDVVPHIQLQRHEETDASIPNSVTSMPFKNKVVKHVAHSVAILTSSLKF